MRLFAHASGHRWSRRLGDAAACGGKRTVRFRIDLPA